MEKLTLEWCFKYPNAKIKANGICYYIGILAFLDFHFDKNELSEDISTCKLILRKIDSLTEEEKDKIDDMVFCDKEVMNWGRLLVIRHYTIIVIDYLRDLNIDIDNLIEKGIADEYE